MYSVRLKVKPDGPKHLKALILSLDEICFPGERAASFEGNYWWIAYCNKTPVGCASMCFLENKKAYFTRCGVIPAHRRNGLQSRLIQARINFANKWKMKKIVTYTMKENCTSSNNLIKHGFRLYYPKWFWATADAIYWGKKLC